MLQDEQEFLFLQAVGVLGVVQDVEEAAAGAELHDDDLAAALLLLLDGEQLDDVLVLDLPQHLELPHLHVVRPHVAELVEGLDSDGLAVVLVDALEHGAGRALPQHARRAPHVVLRASEERHF